jgi:hypothetical protein
MSGDDVAIVAAGSVVNITGINAAAGTIDLENANQLNVNNSNLVIFNGSIVDNGTITVSANSRLETNSGPLSITGSGNLVLDDTGGFAHLFETGGVNTFGSGLTVSGSGQIGLNNGDIINNGTITANVSGRTLDIDANGGNGGVGSGNGVGTGGNAALYNTGTMQASNGGNLAIDSGLYENSTTGVIKANTGSTVSLNGDSRVLNGTLETAGTGVIEAAGANQFLQTVTLSSGSSLSVNNDNLSLNTLLTNNGVITVSNNSRLQSETGSLSITGTGSIVLDNSSGFVQLFESGGQITLGAGQTITGSGQIGLNNAVITNNALINANLSTGTIEIDADGGNGGVGPGNGVGTNANSGFLNNATLEATGGGTLQIDGGLYENAAGGVIKAGAGSAVDLGDDARILNGTLESVGAGVINAVNATQYLQGVTLANGTTVNVNNDNLVLNTSLANNGAITIANNSRLQSETGTLSITGTGSITLDDSSGFAHLFESGGVVTLGSGQTVSGAGNIGLNNAVIINNGVIDANVGGGLDIDAPGGNGGLGGSGVGTGSNAGLLNSGTMEATAGSTLSFESGLYENTATGALKAASGGTVAFNSDASLFNLQSGGVLNKGVYSAVSAGAASALNLRSNAADSIVTIGTSAVGTDTVVTLSGANSVVEVTPFGGGTPTAIDSSLTGVASSGELQLLNGRNLTITAGGGAFSNAGLVQLGASALGATSFANSGTTFGNGTVTVAIANTGTVNAVGGTLSTQAITGATGTISTAATGTLNLGGTSTADFLTNDGHLDLNTNNVTVTSDYQNANFGSGNAFSGHANVSGSGLILAASASQELSGPALSGGVLDVGNVRIGGSSSTTLTITNGGALTTLRGAVQNTDAASVALSGPNFVLAPGASATATISYTGTNAGSLAGQTLNVVNNFDNVASQTVGLTGNVYQIAAAASEPTTIALAAQRVGLTASSAAVTIANVAPNTPGFTESLSSTASVASPFTIGGGTSATTGDIAAGGSQDLALALGTSTAGAFSGVVSITNTSIPVNGSGFTPLALAGQTINVTGNVYATAVATLSSNTVNFGPVRQGAQNVTGSVGVTNAATGALTDNLVTSVGATPSNISATATPGPLAASQTGSANFLLNTSVAGQVTGGAVLGFKSSDSQLADLTLDSQTVNFTGTITELAKAVVELSGGSGTLSGGGATYTLNLGDIAAGTGAVSSDLSFLNDITASSFSETLGGTLTGGTVGGFTFAGVNFSGVAGGDAAGPDLLSFNYTGLSAGDYTDSIVLNPFSHFDGLTNYSLSAITLNITADITGGVAGVPEPSIWAQLILGFGFLGTAMRRRRAGAARQAA